MIKTCHAGWRRRPDSNRKPADPKSAVLPLNYAATRARLSGLSSVAHFRFATACRCRGRSSAPSVPAVTLMFVFAIACRRTPPKREPIALRFSIVCGALVPSRSFRCKRVSVALHLRPFMQKVRQCVRRSKRGFSLPRSSRVDIHAVRMHAEPQKPWWASRDSNPEPTGYEPVALTVAPKALEARLF